MSANLSNLWNLWNLWEVTTRIEELKSLKILLKPAVSAAGPPAVTLLPRGLGDERHVQRVGAAEASPPRWLYSPYS